MALALSATLAGRHADAASMIRSVAERRRTAGDRDREAFKGDGEITFKQAQILALAGNSPAALATLNEAVAQGFVCVACIEASSLLDPVRALPGYADVRGRALARHTAFGRRFGLSSPPSIGHGAR